MWLPAPFDTSIIASSGNDEYFVLALFLCVGGYEMCTIDNNGIV